MKFLISIVLGGALLLISPTKSQAQYYSSYTYNNNAYLNYAIASQKAKATGRRARVSKRSRRARRARVAKRTRRTSRVYSRTYSRSRR